jgi:hypothetical protein
MIQSGSGSRLAFEPFESLAVGSQFLRQELESHISSQPSVVSLVDDTHAAAPQGAQDPIT